MQAAKIAEILLGCYRKGEVDNPQVYTAAVVEVLSAYPTEVMIQVADPVNGLPGKLKFLPTISEIKAECELHAEPLRRQAERDKRIAEQLAERNKREQELKQGPQPAPPQGRTVTYGEALAMGMTRPIGVFETEHMGAKRTVPYRG